ncbi:MAG: anhydro-N-acetylmuramic acid kinase [Bernardetiaceae bacterium]|nr:anhydro-N-acetylmuramic acid kinase [Bernardetiaceae bacterium]
MSEYNFRMLGTMSGTSLDGFDIADCSFKFENNHWHYTLHKGRTFRYRPDLRQKLAHAHRFSAFDYLLLDKELGKEMGFFLREFANNQPYTAIALHGHTVFHQPERGLSSQIGNPAEIFALTGIPVICDFRKQDLALGGQGAPLVPIGDGLLFPDYDLCLNLGGIANISCLKAGKRIAFDICPCNIVLNHLAEKLGKNYDADGKLAAGGRVIGILLAELDELDFYAKNYPKSLGREYIEAQVLPLLEQGNATVADLLATFTAHITQQIARAINKLTDKKQARMLISGGGAYNTFLCDTITRFLPNIEVQIAEKNIIEYKEALIFGLLASLRLAGQNNCLASVTGATHDHVSGAIYGFRKKT